MLKAIRVELFQQTANFRKPASFLVKETYPIAPYSTVIGMIHNACGFTETHDFKVAVQSIYGSETVDLATLYNFGITYDETRHFAKVKNSKGKYDGINRGVRGVQVLTDITTVIYIVPEEKDYETILNGLKNPKNFIALGRYEDIARVDSIEEVELVNYDKVEDDICESAVKYDMYIPTELFKKNTKGTVLNIRKSYSLDKKGEKRVWDSIIKVKYVQKCSKEPELFTDKCYIDIANENLVCLV